MENTLAKFKKLSKKRKLALLFFLVALLVGLFFLFAFLIGNTLSLFKGGGPLQQGLTTGLPLVLILWLVFVGMMLLAIFKKLSLRNSPDTRDDRGVDFMERGTFGTARWLDEDEDAIKDAFYVGDIADTTTYIYGQLTEAGNGEKVVGYKKPKGAEGNRNTFVIGSAGSGKSYTLVVNELVQAIRRGNSLVCVDPGGILYATTRNFITSQKDENGEDIEMLALNLDDLVYSDFWNCLSEVYDPETGRLSASRLNTFVQIYMANSSEGKEDAFWLSAERNLLAATIALNAYKHEQEVLSSLENLYRVYTQNDDINSEKYKNERKVFDDPRYKQKASIVAIKNIVRGAAKRNKIKKTDVEEAIAKLEDTQLLNFATVTDVLRRLGDKDLKEELNKEFEAIKDELHPAKTSFRAFKTANDNIQGSAIFGALQRLSLFRDTYLINVLSRNGIDLKTVNLKQKAIFVIISDKDDTLRPIISLFFSFLFMNVEDSFDKQKALADDEGRANPCLGVTVIMDDFYSIGKLYNFPTFLSVCRKRQIYNTMICQTYAQIADIYGEKESQSIITNCSTVLFLGSNDEETCRYISEFLSGRSTVVTEGHSVTDGVLGPSASETVNISAGQRQLLTLDEARRFSGKIFVSRIGQQPLRLYPFTYPEHPSLKQWVYEYRDKEGNLRKDVERSSVYKNIKPITQRLSEEQLYSVADSKLTEFTMPKIENVVVDENGELIEEKPAKKKINSRKRETKKKSGTLLQTSLLDDVPEPGGFGSQKKF